MAVFQLRSLRFQTSEEDSGFVRIPCNPTSKTQIQHLAIPKKSTTQPNPIQSKTVESCQFEACTISSFLFYWGSNRTMIHEITDAVWPAPDRDTFFTRNLQYTNRRVMRTLSALPSFFNPLHPSEAKLQLLLTVLSIIPDRFKLRSFSYRHTQFLLLLN